MKDGWRIHRVRTGCPQGYARINRECGEIREEKVEKFKDKKHSSDLFRRMNVFFPRGAFSGRVRFPVRGFCPALPTHRSPLPAEARFLPTGAVHLLDISENISKGLAVRHP